MNRRQLLTAAGSGAAAATGAALWAQGLPVAAEPSQDEDDGAGKGEVSVRWLGTNAWEFRCDGATVLVDPWVTRFVTGATKGSDWDMDAELVVDTAAVDEHITAADCVLVTHGHWDHITDVPYVAAKTGATVLGTETHLNLLRAMETPEEQLAQVSGGEYYQFDGFTVEVLTSLHNVSGRHKNLLFPGTHDATPKRPTTVRHLVEGGSLAYLVTMGGVSLLIGVTTNFQRRDFAGLKPQVLFMQTANPNSPRYVERLLETTGHPPFVVPTHWDDYEEPLKEPAIDWLGVDDLEIAVAEASPDSRFVLLDHLESTTFTV